MTGYLLRRLAYGVLILLGVNLLTFGLFFAVNTPDDMARLSILKVPKYEHYRRL